MPLERVAVASLLVGPFAVAAHLANTLKDFEGDAAVRSGNLAQRLGRSRASVLAIAAGRRRRHRRRDRLWQSRAGSARHRSCSALVGLLAIAQGIGGAARLWAGMLVAAVSWTAAWALATG